MCDPCIYIYIYIYIYGGFSFVRTQRLLYSRHIFKTSCDVNKMETWKTLRICVTCTGAMLIYTRRRKSSLVHRLGCVAGNDQPCPTMASPGRAMAAHGRPSDGCESKMDWREEKKGVRITTHLDILGRLISPRASNEVRMISTSRQRANF